ncbi:hypothetical protein EYF80_015143 [Liparis tanakae]|uniref:Uncharacterized protein n=1 Tax=Liparis tanakae TaxID=230148 RepID=A0A4Z2I993_9TELE|nr:hypothetical protein EYF80_015143 [Liparis tanakae]
MMSITDKVPLYFQQAVLVLACDELLFFHRDCGGRQRRARESKERPVGKPPVAACASACCKCSVSKSPIFCVRSNTYFKLSER